MKVPTVTVVLPDGKTEEYISAACRIIGANILVVDRIVMDAGEPTAAGVLCIYNSTGWRSHQPGEKDMADA